MMYRKCVIDDRCYTQEDRYRCDG